MPPKAPRTPKNVDIDITNRCNLRCKYCYHFTSPGDVAADLPTEEWLAFFEELGECAVVDVTLCGGEPFCREDLHTLIEGIVRNRMRFTILTNGTLITDEAAAFLASTRRCDTVQVSIDGATPESHDAARGAGTLERAVQGVRRLQAHKLNATVRVTVHRHNVHRLEEVARLLLEELGLPTFSTNSTAHLGLCRGNESEIALSVAEYIEAMKTLEALDRKYEGRITAAAGPQAIVKQWRKMLEARSRTEPPEDGKGFLGSCGGVFAKLAVRADGVMTPCTMMSHVELGRINRDRVRDVWQSHPEMIRLRERQSIPLRSLEHCRDCDFADYCLGGCPASAYALSGQDRHPSLDQCLRRFLEMGGRLPEEPAAATSQGRC